MKMGGHSQSSVLFGSAGLTLKEHRSTPPMPPTRHGFYVPKIGIEY